MSKSLPDVDIMVSFHAEAAAAVSRVKKQRAALARDTCIEKKHIAPEPTQQRGARAHNLCALRKRLESTPDRASLIPAQDEFQSTAVAQQLYESRISALCQKPIPVIKAKKRAHAKHGVARKPDNDTALAYQRSLAAAALQTLERVSQPAERAALAECMKISKEEAQKRARMQNLWQRHGHNKDLTTYLQRTHDAHFVVGVAENPKVMDTIGEVRMPPTKEDDRALPALVVRANEERMKPVSWNCNLIIPT